MYLLSYIKKFISTVYIGLSSTKISDKSISKDISLYKTRIKHLLCTPRKKPTLQTSSPVFFTVKHQPKELISAPGAPRRISCCTCCDREEGKGTPKPTCAIRCKLSREYARSVQQTGTEMRKDKPLADKKSRSSATRDTDG